MIQENEEQNQKEGINQSKWLQTEEGHWKLFFNSDYKIFEEENIKKKKALQNVKFNTNSNINKIKLGCKVMTPLGIGTLLRIEEDQAEVKFLKLDKNAFFDIKFILPEFPINLRMATNEFGSWYKINIPANGDVPLLKKLIDRLQLVDTVNCDYMLINQGMEMKETATFEQLELKSEAKILLCGMKKIEQKLSRFEKISDYWYCNPDAIVFSVSRRIKLTGVGLYCSMEGQSQNGTIKVAEVEGEGRGRNRRGRGRGRNQIAENSGNYRETMIFEQPASVPDLPDKTNPIYRVNLDKPVTIKAHHDYKIEFNCTNPSETYFGTAGKATVSGAKNIEFYFKQSLYSSSQTQGNFPELYYFH